MEGKPKDERIRFETLPQPKIIVMEGISGTGKTTQGFRLERLLEGRTINFPNSLGVKALDNLGENKDFNLNLFNAYLTELRDFTAVTDSEFVLCEGGYSSLISKSLSLGIPLQTLKNYYTNLNNRMIDFKRDFGYLELILIPESDKSDMATGLQMFKGSIWGASINCEFVSIENDETILSIAKKVKQILEKYNVEFEN